MTRDVRFDEIGYWSEVKLAIIREYAAAYSRILAAQTAPQLQHVYIDAFAGPGIHVSKTTGEFVRGSPTNALLVVPPFHDYHFIDLDDRKIEVLEQIAADRQNVRVHHGDCNKILLENVFPTVQFEDYKRALCILDPYGLHLDWEVIRKAGEMRSIEIFLNFPLMDINRNVLRHDRGTVPSEQAARMSRFWGDESWQGIAYVPSGQKVMFGDPAMQKQPNDALVAAFRRRLKDLAGFAHVPQPMPMRNSQNAVVYCLFFASQKPVAQSIVQDIFHKYAKGQPNGG